MKRVIKFRAWDEGNKKMFTDVQFIKSGDEGNDWICFTSNEKQYGVEENKIVFDNPYCRPQIHLMQFIGLLDKNGKEIYEGQEVKSPENQLRGYVEFHAGAFSLKITMSANQSFDVGQSIALYNFDKSALEITERNIYENPDILK